MTTQVAEYSATEAGLAELRARHGATIYDVRVPGGMQAARLARAEIREVRVSLEARRVALKAPVLERGRLIDAEAKRITEALLQLETPIDEAIKAEEARREEERARKQREVEARAAQARAFVDSIRAPLMRMVGRSSAEISAQIQVTQDTTVPPDSFEALEAKASTLASLVELRDAALRHEAEQARIAAERAELERRREEEEARQAAERQRIAEEERVAREARERADAEARTRREEEARVELGRIAAQARAARERIEAEEAAARAAREAADAEAKSRRDAEEGLLRIERAKLEKARADADAKRRKAEEEKQAKEAAKRRKEAELMEARALLETFRARFGALEEFAAVVREINAVLGEEASNVA